MSWNSNIDLKNPHLLIRMCIVGMIMPKMIYSLIEKAKNDFCNSKEVDIRKIAVFIASFYNQTFVM